MIFSGIIAAVTAAATFIGGLGAIGTFALQMAASIGLSYLAKAIAGNKQQAASSTPSTMGVQGTLQTGGDVARSFVMGKGATAGSLVYANTWGNDGATPNAYLTQVIAISDLPVKGLLEVWANGEMVTLTTEAPTSAPDDVMALWKEAMAACLRAGLSPMFSEAGRQFIANYIQTHSGAAPGTGGVTEMGYPVLQYRKDGKDHLWIKFYDGTQTAVDPFLVSKVGSTERPYEATRVGTGIAYVVCTSLVNDTLFTGFPQFVFGVDGVPLYDPSKDDTAGGDGDHRYTDPATWGGDGDDLPAVQVYNLLRGISYGGQWFYGLQGVTAARLPAANWIAQINKCRAEVDAGDGETEPAYRSGGQVVISAQLGDAIESLLTACQGKLSEIGGVYKIHLGAPDSPSFAFTDDDIISTAEQSFTPFFGLADTITGVAAKYPEPAEAWAMKPAPPLYRTDLDAKAGNRRLMADVSLDFVPYAAQAQRLMQSALLAAQRARRHTFTLPPSFWFVEPGDVGEWTSARNGYESKLFEVNGAVDKANLDITVDLTEVDPADFEWDFATDFVPPTTGPTVFPRPAAQPIIDWYAEPAIIKDSNGINRRPAIRLSWDGEMPGVIGVQYEVRLKSDGSEVARGRTDQIEAAALLISQGLLPATLYQTRGRYIPSAPRETIWSDWLDVTTPDVRLTQNDFAAGLRDYVTRELPAQIAAVDFKAQQIAANAAEQDAANELANRAVRTLLQSQGVTISETAQIALGIDGKLTGAVFSTIDNNGFVTGTLHYNDGSTGDFVVVATNFYVAAPGVNGGEPLPLFKISTSDGEASVVVRGNIIGDGEIKAYHMEVAELSAITADCGTLTAGKIQSADEMTVFELAAGTLTFYREV